MSASVIGALVGLGLALLDYFVFGTVIRNQAGNASDPRKAAILDMLRKAFLVVFPIVGWFLGPLVLQNYGGP